MNWSGKLVFMDGLHLVEGTHYKFESGALCLHRDIFCEVEQDTVITIYDMVEVSVLHVLIAELRPIIVEGHIIDWSRVVYREVNPLEDVS